MRIGGSCQPYVLEASVRVIEDCGAEGCASIYIYICSHMKDVQAYIYICSHMKDVLAYICARI